MSEYHQINIQQGVLRIQDRRMKGQGIGGGGCQE